MLTVKPIAIQLCRSAAQLVIGTFEENSLPMSLRMLVDARRPQKISLEGRARTDRSIYVDETGGMRASNRFSVGVVALLPLYCALELDREREREYMRRTKMADAVGSFVANPLTVSAFF